MNIHDKIWNYEDLWNKNYLDDLNKSPDDSTINTIENIPVADANSRSLQFSSPLVGRDINKAQESLQFETSNNPITQTI